MKKDYVMQSVQRKRYRKTKRSNDWVAYVMVLFCGLAIGSYMTFRLLEEQSPSGHPTIVQAKAAPKVKVVTPKKKKEHYDFYTLLKQHADSARSSLSAQEMEGYVLQVGVFQQSKACKDLGQKLKRKGFSVIQYHDVHDAHMCRVYIGPYAALSKAYQGQRSLLHNGYRSLLRKWSQS